MDPTIKTPEYYQELQNRANSLPEDSVAIYKFQHYEDIPTGLDLKPSVIIRIHLNINDDIALAKIAYLDRLTNKNIKSRLIIRYDVSHMIHYHIPHVIIDSIKEISKL